MSYCLGNGAFAMIGYERVIGLRNLRENLLQISNRPRRRDTPLNAFVPTALFDDGRQGADSQYENEDVP